MPHNEPIRSKDKRYGRQIRRFLVDHGWLLIGIAAIVVFCLGCFGFKDYYDNYTNPKTVYTCWDLGHMSFQLFRLGTVLPPSQKPWLLELARTLATLITLTAAIKALMLFFQEKLQRLRLVSWRNHAVICGLGEKGQQLALDLLENGDQVVVIDQNAQNDKSSRLLELGAIVLTGDASRTSQLLKAKANYARYLFAVTLDDWTNLEIGLCAHKLMTEEKIELPTWRHRLNGVLKLALVRLNKVIPWIQAPDISETTHRQCFVHLVDNELHHLFAQHRIFAWIGGQTTINSFNIYENAARQLFHVHFPEKTADRLGQETVHLLIVGFGQMGRSVALQFAKIGHYAHGRPIRITVIDKSAERLQKNFLRKYPSFNSTCELKCIELETDDLLSPTIFDQTGGAQTITMAIICLEQESAAHVCALQLLRVLDMVRCPLLVRVNTETHLARLLGKEVSGASAVGERIQRIYPFGTIVDSCSSNMVLNDEIDAQARQIHAAYCTMKLRLNVDPDSDPAMKPWDQLDENYKESNRAQAEHLDVKLRAVGCERSSVKGEVPTPFVFTKEEIDLLAPMEHARWNTERFLAGWTGGPRDPEKKTSPYLVSWEQLDEDIKEYDRNTIRKLPEMLASEKIREEIVRMRVNP